MKSVLELNEKKVPVVRIDKALNKYDDVVLFPEKVKKARESFKKFGIPDLKKRSQTTTK
ncbi:hypothetical protein [Parafilimonas terrae]|uniref:Uncharacterized protein n=1 Tax=Parafilimonas terrae TaxID=1465490 RepID=A0A1I5UDH9_9BACT|nr:hypothetical protein [Parafilimonas terrae]SFP93274.1 hypothetical protein SAMN05444277_103220 [Parafilimonas terrae]